MALQMVIMARTKIGTGKQRARAWVHSVGGVTEAAKRAGMSPLVLAQWLSRQRSGMRPGNTRKLAAAMGVSYETIEFHDERIAN